MLEGNTGITGNDENVLVSTQKSYHTMLYFSVLWTLNSGYSLWGGQTSLALIEALFESPHPPFKSEVFRDG